MKRVLLALALVGLMGGVAAADQYDLTGGVLILHAPPGLTYTTDPFDWCTTVGLADCCLDQVNQFDCDDAVAHVWYVVSQFYESKTFGQIEFGITYDPSAWLLAGAGFCWPPTGGLITEYPGEGSWPYDGSAVALAVSDEEWSGACVATHWLAGYSYCDPLGPGIGMIDLVASPQTSFIGWGSMSGLFSPDCVGAMGIGQAGRPCCSEAPEPFACCLPDGNCVDVMTEAECDGMGGVAYPDICANTACPQPPEPEACCFPDGSCQMLLEGACVAAGGTFYAGEDCATYQCPIELMACCMPDGSCVDVLDQAECDGMGGVLYPTNYCAEPDFVCPQPPPEFACCFEFDNACYMMTEADCQAGGGMWNDGMVCTSAGGDFDCPFWAVCCVGEDCTITTAEGCQGEFHPEWDSCTPDNPCEYPVPNEPASWGSIKSIYR